MAHWRSSTGNNAPLELDCQPLVAMVLLHWLSERYHHCHVAPVTMEALGPGNGPDDWRAHSCSGCFAGSNGNNFRSAFDCDSGSGSSRPPTARSESYARSSSETSCSSARASSSSSSSGDGAGSASGASLTSLSGKHAARLKLSGVSSHSSTRCDSLLAEPVSSPMPGPQYAVRRPLHGLLCNPPFPPLPPQLQPEMDALLDYLGLASEVYGILPHVRCTNLPSLTARHDAAPLFSYRSRPTVLLLDGHRLWLRARGYAHASAPLAAVPPPPRTPAASVPKLLWKVRLLYGSSSAAHCTAGMAPAECRPDTSLGVLLVNVEDGDGRQPPACRQTTAAAAASPATAPATAAAAASGSAIPVISLAQAAAWSGPLPLLAAALPAAAPGGGPVAAAAAAASGGGGQSSVYLPGFCGWHVAGLAKSHAEAGAIGGGLTRVLLKPARCSPAQQPDVAVDGSDGNCSCGGACMFFEHNDVLLFGMDLSARRLEMHHCRLGRSYSVGLPPGPPAGTREVLYAHVCMYDAGEGLELLDLTLNDLEVMGCI